MNGVSHSEINGTALQQCQSAQYMTVLIVFKCVHCVSSEISFRQSRPTGGWFKPL